MPVLNSTDARWGDPLPRTLSRQAVKRSLYGCDIDFLDGWHDLTVAAGDHDGDVVDLLDTTALLLLKPDAVVSRRVGAALDWLTTLGAEVVAAEICTVDPMRCRALWRYQWNIATPARRRVTECYMGMTRTLVLVVRLARADVPATVAVAHLKGPAAPSAQRPEHLRKALRATDHLVNGVHSADEPADVVRELSVLLTGEQRRRVARSLAAGATTATGPVVDRLYADVPALDPDARDDLRLGPPGDPTAWALDLCDVAEDAARAPRMRWAALLRAAQHVPRDLVGVDRIVPGTPVDLWRTQPAGAARA